MAERDMHSAFQLIRPICVQLAKEHNQGNVETLVQSLKQLDNQQVQQLQEYTIFPLRLILKQSQCRSDDLHAAVLSALQIIVEHSVIKKWELFENVFTSVCISVSLPNASTPVASVSEEMKLAAVCCLHAIICHSDNSVLERMYSAQFLPPLGHAVTVLLHIAEHEKLRKLRVEALLCLQALMGKFCKIGMSILLKAGDTVAAFFPGITMATCRIITGDMKQGHSVTVAAIETMQQATSIVMGDLLIKRSQQNKLKMKDHKGNNNKLGVERTPEWVTTTCEKMKLLIDKMVLIAGHMNWRVRLALIQCARCFATTCMRSLSLCLSRLLEVLVGAVGDEYTKVADEAYTALQEFQELQSTEESGTVRPLVEIVGENLHELVTTLPRLMRTTDEDQKLTHVHVLSGYLRVLGPNLSRLCNAHLERLTTSLLQVLELDTNQLHIIEDRTAGDQPHAICADTVYQQPTKYFLHFTEERIYSELIKVCRLLGYYGDLAVLLDFFISVAHLSSLHRKEAFLVLNEVLLGAKGIGLHVESASVPLASDEDLESCIRSLVSDYLSPEFYDVPVANSHQVLPEKGVDWQVVKLSETPKHSLQVINSNILQVCLILDGLANFSQVLGHQFEVLLMDILYAVLIKLGCGTVAIRHTAHLTLLQITASCGYSTPSELLCANADYLVNSVSLCLRHQWRHPEAPGVLSVILMYSEAELLPLVKPTITDILTSLDSDYDERGDQLMRVLLTLAGAIHRWHPPHTNSATMATKVLVPCSSQVHTGPEEVRRYLLDCHQQYRVASSGCLHDDPSECDAGEQKPEMKDETEDTDPDMKPEPPLHVKLLQGVMERCTHLLYAGDARLRLLVLDTVAECCQVLAEYTDILLPLAHKIWPPYVNRLSDEEPMVIIKAVGLLQLLGEVCGDFIRRRVDSEVVPKLCHTLQMLAPSSAKSGPAYKWTVNCKLQKTILSTLGPLCHKSGLRENQLTPVFNSCIPYLSCRQPGILQESCMCLLRQLAKGESDTVWLLLQDIYCPTPPTPPHHTLQAIQMAGPPRWNEFSENVIKVLD